MAIRPLELQPAPETALYLRISKDSEGRGLGVARQEKDCRTLADFKGWPVARLYIDSDISASRKGGHIADRPEFRRLCSDIEAGAVKAVLAYDLDRLFRDVLQQEEFFILCERAGMHRLATPGDDVNIETGEGLLVARIKAAVAAEETRKMGKRVRSKKLQLAEAGLPSGGRKRYGYDRDGMTIREEEAAVLREAAARVLAGRSLGAYIRELNDARVPTPAEGTCWRQSTIRGMLMKPSLAGLREHQGVVIGEAAWPPILDRGTWEAVCAILNDPSRKPVAGNRRTHLLTGILVCGLCGARLNGGSGGSRRPGVGCYVCNTGNGGCGRTNISANNVEPLVIGAVREALASPAFVAAYRAADQGQSNDTEALAATVTTCEAKLKELAASWGADEISKAEWLTARATVEARLDEARSHLAAYKITRTPLEGLTGPGVFDAAWREKTMDEKRAIIADLIEAVVINPTKVRGGHVFDASRVATPVWRV